MTPEEKAKELILKFAFKGAQHEGEAKKFALIAVDEILQKGMLDNAPFMNNGKDLMKSNFIRYKKYWQEVKQEIEKL